MGGASFSVWLKTSRSMSEEKTAQEISSTIVASKKVGLYGGCLNRISLFSS